MRPRLLVLATIAGIVGLVLVVRSTSGTQGGRNPAVATSAAPATTGAPSEPHEDDHHHDEDVPHGELADAASPPPVPAAVDEASRSPLVQALPQRTTRYRIDGRIAADGELELTITLNAILNHSSQLPRYTEQLRRYKAEALAFIGLKGGDPSDYRIRYVPPEAASL